MTAKHRRAGAGPTRGLSASAGSTSCPRWGVAAARGGTATVTLIARDQNGHCPRRSTTPAPHANVSLSEGELEGCTLECWLHGSRFDMLTGEPTGSARHDPSPSTPSRSTATTSYVAAPTRPNLNTGELNTYGPPWRSAA